MAGRVARQALAATRQAAPADQLGSLRARAAVLLVTHERRLAARQADTIDSFLSLRATGRHAAPLGIAHHRAVAGCNTVATHQLLTWRAAARRRAAQSGAGILLMSRRAVRHALAAKALGAGGAALVRRDAEASLVAAVALLAGRQAGATIILVARLALRLPALTVEARVLALWALRRHAVTIRIAHATIGADRLTAVAGGALVAVFAGRRRRHAARWMCNVADIVLRTLRQAYPLIARRPVARRHAATGFGVVAKALRALRLVVAPAEPGRVDIAALRAVGHAGLPRLGVDHAWHAGTAAARLILIRRTVIRIIKVAMISFGAVGQRHLVVAHRAAVFAGRQAHTGIAGVAREVARAGRQAVVAVDLLPRRATGLWQRRRRRAAAGHTAASVYRNRSGAGEARLSAGHAWHCGAHQPHEQD